MTADRTETLPGLPEPLPAGERLVMQVRPEWRSFAIHVFHARKIALYCALLLAWRVAASLAAGASLGAALADAAAILPIALVGVAIPVVLAFFYARTSIYTLTDKRLVMRIGVALPMTFNLPYRQIESAALRLYRDGTGDVPVHLSGGVRLAYLHLWPHARPWRIESPEPMLRAVPDAAKVAETLSGLLRDAKPRGRATGEVAGAADGDVRPFVAAVPA